LHASEIEFNYSINKTNAEENEEKKINNIYARIESSYSESSKTKKSRTKKRDRDSIEEAQASSNKKFAEAINIITNNDDNNNDDNNIDLEKEKEKEKKKGKEKEKIEDLTNKDEEE
jgi:hypothetical protein